ncbi:hypothetical protein GW17_00048137 [Ensete ventricosum]|nr:hypothetical protein GW17_00048137 [Ensete ventricosum]
MHRVGVRTMRLGTRQKCVRSSTRVSRVCQDGAREFTGRRLRLIGRLSGVAKRLTGSLTTMGERVTDHTWTPDQAKESGQGLDDAEGARWEFARRFTEGIRKLAWNK